MIRRPKSSDSSTRSGSLFGTPSSIYHTPPALHVPNNRPDWMSLTDIPDERCYNPQSDEEDEELTEQKGLEGHVWDGNKKLFVQLLDDMDNIGGIAGLSDGSARRRRKARELFTDWLFRGNKSESTSSPSTPSHHPVLKLRSHASQEEKSRRFSGDFTNFDVRIPVVESPRPLPGRLERQAPSRRSCGVIGDRKQLFEKWRHSVINFPTEDEADSGYHSGKSGMLGGGPSCPGELTLTREDLKKRIEKFNITNNHGLLMEMPLERTTCFQGFIRVHMNLIRPINMRIMNKPPTFINTLTRKKKGRPRDQEVESDGGQELDSPLGTDESIISFNLPRHTSKVIHINSVTKTTEVISILLSKFNITDNPRKFSLYERIEFNDKTKPSMRKMHEDETPLVMCLVWSDEAEDGLDRRKFVLQEDDVGEIVWEAFSLPELESFLHVLNKEEVECTNQIKNKYFTIKHNIYNQIRSSNSNNSSKVNYYDNLKFTNKINNNTKNLKYNNNNNNNKNIKNINCVQRTETIIKRPAIKTKSIH